MEIIFGIIFRLARGCGCAQARAGMKRCNDSRAARNYEIAQIIPAIVR
jgi:hypothetical protein